MQTISTSEAARRLGYSHHTVRKWINAGLLRAKIFPDGRARIEPSELQRFFDSLPSAENRESLEVSERSKPGQ